MDPNETLRALLLAIQDRDYDEIETSAQAIIEWIASGGFTPSKVAECLTVFDQS